ncbi:MAG: DUF1836 domain-containing protein [Clostridia bacterium]|nr:DUF1836 domain-containing protein [Clostridia bacterium]
MFLYWNQRISQFKLPEWDELPVFDLYMDQVIKLLNNYLNLYTEAADNEKGITQSMINNYVKLKIIPSPEKKRYSRIHLAYLIIVCVLKQTLSISTIQNIIPLDISEENVKKIYTAFVLNQIKSYQYVSENISNVANLLIESEGDNPERLNDLVMQLASSANIFKMMSEIFCNTKES